MHRPKKVSTDNYSKLWLNIYLTAQSTLGLRHYFHIVLHCQVKPGGASRCVRLAEKVKVFIFFMFYIIFWFTKDNTYPSGFTNLGAVTLSPRRAWTTTWTAFTARYLMNCNRFGIQVIQDFVDQIFQGMLLIRLLDNQSSQILAF